MLLVTINEKGHWNFNAKDAKNLTKTFFQKWRKFIALIIQMFVEPLKSNNNNNININKEPVRYKEKIDSSNNLFFLEPYIPILKT